MPNICIRLLARGLPAAALVLSFGALAWWLGLPTHRDRVYQAAGLAPRSLREAGPDSRDPGNVRLLAASVPWSARAAELPEVDRVMDDAKSFAPDLVVLPEGFPFGAPVELDGPRVERLGQAAARSGAHVIISVYERLPRGVRPVALLFDRRGRLVGRYARTHALPGEGVSVGDSLPVFDLGFGRVGVKLGSDAYFPEVDMAYARQGARLIVWATAPFPVEDQRFWELTQRGRAVDNDVYLLISRYSGDSVHTANFRRYGSVTKALGRAGVLDAHGQWLASSGTGGRWALAVVPRAELARRPALPAERTTPVGVRLDEWIAGGWRERLRPSPPGRRQVVLSVLHQDLDATPDGDFTRTLALVDTAGQRRSDLTVLYEFSERIDGVLPRLQALARRHRMYLVLAGPVNAARDVEAVLLDRAGRVAGRYRKLTGNRWADTIPVFDLDVGRLGIRICADKYYPQIDRVFALSRVDMVADPDQSWGEGATELLARAAGRSLDNGFIYLRATHVSEEVGHQSRVISRYGEALAQSQHGAGVVTAFVDLGDEPRAYAWDANDVRYALKSLALRVLGVPQPSWKDKRIPADVGPLREQLLAQRRPELYRRYLLGR